MCYKIAWDDFKLNIDLHWFPVHSDVVNDMLVTTC